MRATISFITPIGNITLTEDKGCIIECRLGKTNMITKPTSLLKKARHQLEEYFSGRRKEFSLPLAPKGTPFQQQVWQALQHISYGQTASYKDIAQAIKNPQAYRAVGMANNKNPIMIIIPCHRVIGVKGSLVGYAGGLAIKQFLLNLEQNNK